MVSAKLPGSSISGLPSSKSNTDKVRPLSIAKPAGSTLTSIAEAASTKPSDLAPDLGINSGRAMLGLLVGCRKKSQNF